MRILARKRPEFPIRELQARSYSIPLGETHSDGTAKWTRETLVIAEVSAGNKTGVGYTFGSKATAEVINSTLQEEVQGQDAMSIPLCHERMIRAVRNLGRQGIASGAIAAVDCALWDLKAKLLDLPLATLLGQARDSVPAYWSGGLTSSSSQEVEAEFAKRKAQGFRMFKMKVGRNSSEDRDRVRAARRAIGWDSELFVDANGAYNVKEALKQAEVFNEYGVTWFEEPVSSDDLEALRLVRERGPAGMQIAAGEYGYDLHYFGNMIESSAVDVVQADASRCEGITGFLGVASLCQTRSLPLSAHTVPSEHLHVCAAIPNLVHLEYFIDHVGVEEKYFDRAYQLRDGRLWPDLSAPGLGFEIKRADLEKVAA